MVSGKRLTAGWTVMAVLAVCHVGFAQTIAVGTDGRNQGSTVTLHVTLSAPISYTAVLVRLSYDPNILANPSVTRGALLSPNHTLLSFSPAPGRFNVAIYGDSGVPSFFTTDWDTTLFCLRFYIKPSAPFGAWPVTFTTVGTPALPASDLTDTRCHVAPHIARPGWVEVGLPGAAKEWRSYE